MPKIAWRPYGDYKNKSRVALFMRKHGIKTVQELHRRSVEDPDWFWCAVNEDLGIEWFTGYHTTRDMSGGMPWTKWFLGGTINIAYNCIDRHILNGEGDHVALIRESEEGDVNILTYRDLYVRVGELARAMVHEGIRKGDTVGVCMGSTPEAAIVMYAAMKIGAVPMLPAASIGAEMFADYLARAKAKILFAHKGYRYNGKLIDLASTVKAALTHVPTLSRVVLVSRRDVLAEYIPDDERCVPWSDFLWHAYDDDAPPSHNEHLDAEDPALILLSSGTTGKPKIVVHAQGGMLVNVVKELGYAFDVRADDVFFWQTNVGWMMWPWEIIGVHFFGGSVVCYDGNPSYPNKHRLFEMIERHHVTHFGFTPGGIGALRASDGEYSRHNLFSLRFLGSTGAPLKEETWWWFFETFGKRLLPIMNISGGTEIDGCFVSPLPNMPQKPGTVGGPALGMDLAVLDEEGNPVPLGTEGVLACRKPFPSMTRGFLGDPDAFLEAYFSHWPGIWRHPDRIVVDEDGFWFINGRADDLIVRYGTKFDPVVIEETLKQFSGIPAVIDAIVAGVPDTDPDVGHRIVCFIATQPSGDSCALTGELLGALRAHVRSIYNKQCMLDEVYVLSVLARTKTDKVPRQRYVKACLGQPAGDTSTINNAHVFDEIARLRSPYQP